MAYALSYRGGGLRVGRMGYPHHAPLIMAGATYTERHLFSSSLARSGLTIRAVIFVDDSVSFFHWNHLLGGLKRTKKF